MMKPGTIFLASFLMATFLSACTHMDGVVKDIKLNKEGDLIVTKCDEMISWNVIFVIGSETNCRTEVKPRPSTP
jgi:predicted small secreted protein